MVLVAELLCVTWLVRLLIFYDFWSFLVFDFLVLVGAFSIFGRADTGKPVQI